MARGAPLSLHDLALCLRPVARARAAVPRPADGVECGRARRRARGGRVRPVIAAGGAVRGREGAAGDGGRRRGRGRRRAASRARATAAVLIRRRREGVRGPRIYSPPPFSRGWGGDPRLKVTFSRGWLNQPRLKGFFRSRAQRPLVAVGLANRD